MSFSVEMGLGLAPESEQGVSSRAASRTESATALQPGAQTLLTMPSMSTGLSHLPDAAGENLLVVSPWAPSRVESALRDHELPVGNCGLIPVNGSPVTYDGPLWTTDAVPPSDLTGLSMRYCEAMRHVEPGEGWVLIDNAQVLLMYADDERVGRLLGRLTQQAREREVTGVLAVDRGAVAMETLARLRNLVDAVVER
ncbi:DUF7504 family protein [Halolamina salifodinae]|uniref:DUF835 domain-containing protein n=1 Tax=Halolamina salifodinae TaxID=1202767 RepID=A0A8T4GWH6_9EURY|nr:hypothetical protein [Halolamina salifodinae]MBP1985685.1 hypothetical protein [Halolamina salifodinae]